MKMRMLPRLQRIGRIGRHGGTKATVAIADRLMNIVHELDSEMALKYNKFYIGLAKDGRANNFIFFRPQKRALVLELKLKQATDIQSKIDETGLDTLSYDNQFGNYRLILTSDDLAKHEQALRELISLAHENRRA